MLALSPIAQCMLTLSPTASCMLALSPVASCMLALSPVASCVLALSPAASCVLALSPIASCMLARACERFCSFPLLHRAEQRSGGLWHRWEAASQVLHLWSHGGCGVVCARAASYGNKTAHPPVLGVPSTCVKCWARRLGIEKKSIRSQQPGAWVKETASHAAEAKNLQGPDCVRPTLP